MEKYCKCGLRLLIYKWTGLGERARRASYGAQLRGLEDFESVCVSLAEGQFEGYCPLDAPAFLAQVRREDCESFVRENLRPERLAMSVLTAGKDA